MKTCMIAITLLSLSCVGSAHAESGRKLTGEELSSLLGNGATLQLGGEGMGYKGTLKLNKNGAGKGSAKTDDGTNLTFTGTWAIKGDTFCRTWAEFNDGKEVCETWRLTSARSVDVYNGSEKIGVNSW